MNDLTEIAYSKLPFRFHEEYDLLYRKLHQETISDIEHKRLLALVEISESHQIKCLAALTDLAIKNKLSLHEMKEKLGLRELVNLNLPIQ